MIVYWKKAPIPCLSLAVRAGLVAYRTGGFGDCTAQCGGEPEGNGMQRLDVAVLGGGVAGLTAAYLLRDRELEVFDSAAHIGGRTRSLQQPDGIRSEERRVGK